MKQPLHYLFLLGYLAIMAFGLILFKANILLVLFVLVVTPLLVLWYREDLKSRFAILIMLATYGFALLASLFAYLNGIWYEISVTDIRLFSLVPVESLFAASVHILFYVSIYEYFFDDRQSEEKLHYSQAYFAAVLGMFALVAGYSYAFSSFVISFAFFWLILFLCLLLGYGILLLAGGRLHLLKKGLLFGLSMIPISFIYEWVALSNNLRFFANTQEYLYVFNISKQIIPIEELLFILLIPLLVAVYYELFFDDGK